MNRPSKSQTQRDMGLRLRIVREAKGLNQQQLGDLMGVSATAITNYERGTRQIDLVGLAWAADELEFSPDFIVLGKLGNTPMDLAVRIQEIQRRYVANPPKPRGPKPGRPFVPTVNEAPDAATPVIVPRAPRPAASPTRSSSQPPSPKRTLHERPPRFGEKG